ncbi:prolipoprotein diacylglyceryl transferase [Olivibacter sitiensis]|uniref:prolipoprotein diacylglyceryl transferase n=1 Tax=Olivibacter sitiensis TaxID=376470 RepID=UPI0004194F7E|nr:prolipoprotein diacylglyceryl transferase [Olivibacter sitiensis]
MSISAFIHWGVSPEIFSLGSLSVRYYSLLFAGGIIICFLIMKQVFERQKYPLELLDKLTLYVVLGTVIGARLGHCLFYEPQYYLEHPLEIILPFKGFPGTDNFKLTGFQGLASHGAAVGIVIGTYLFCRKYKFKFLHVFDLLSLVIPVAAASIRLGNLFNSEILGKPTELPWAFVFTRIDKVPRHPAQLYECLCYLAIFLFINWRLRPQLGKYPNGFIFGFMLLTMFTTRFLLEFVKEDQEAFEQGMLLNMGQLLSIPFMALGAYLVLSKRGYKL